MLVSAKKVVNTIKYLDRNIFYDKGNLVVVQRLTNGSYVNTDSVIVNGGTLAPVESYSDLNSSKDSFVYKNGRVTGTMLSLEGVKKGTTTEVDVPFNKPMFNGLIYAETFQALSYTKKHPFIIAEYVPGHQTKFSKVEYVKDEILYFANKPITAKVIKVHSNGGDIYYWLGSENQELFKIEAQFPSFEYHLLKTL